MDATNTLEWGNGEVVFVMVAVKDTGIGISSEGQTRLFERFRQATPKTEEVYGGSGLGLNISRKLCHLHGGEIGVASKEGSGSTFGFFFKARKTEPAPEDPQHAQREADLQDEMKKGIKKHGNASPKDLHPDGVPSSLESPPVKSSDDANPRPQGPRDERYHQTAEVASRVREPEPDTYANSARPKISKQHRTGTHLQSDAIVASSAHRAGGSNGLDSASPRGESRQHVLLVEGELS